MNYFYLSKRIRDSVLSNYTSSHHVAKSAPLQLKTTATDPGPELTGLVGLLIPTGTTPLALGDI